MWDLQFGRRLQTLTVLLESIWDSRPIDALPVVPKPFCKAHDIGIVRQRITRRGGDRTYTVDVPNLGLTLRHKCDGFIFVPDQRYVCSTDIHLLKWKWFDDLSIDFLIKRSGNGLSISFRAEGDAPVDMTDIVHDTTGRGGTQLPLGDLARIYADYNQYQRPNIGMVGEFAFNPQTGIWGYNRPREDKLKVCGAANLPPTLRAAGQLPIYCHQHPHGDWPCVERG